MARFHVARILKLLTILTASVALGYLFAAHTSLSDGTGRDLESVQGALVFPGDHKLEHQAAPLDLPGEQDSPGAVRGSDKGKSLPKAKESPPKRKEASPKKEEAPPKKEEAPPKKEEAPHKDASRREKLAPEAVHPADNGSATGNSHMEDDAQLYNQFQKAPFEEGDSKQLVILAYQRVGSSFFGEIFDLNPDIFYVYEPLDGLYQSLYGTASGMSVPSDITAFSNGTDRLLPEHEVIAASQFLDDLLECRVPKLPTEFVLHRFWSYLAVFMPSWKPYLTCLTKVKAIKALESCANTTSLRAKCPARFGDRLPASEACRVNLDSAMPPRAEMVAPYAGYRACLDDQRRKSKQCVSLMEAKCSNTSFRATKTVRGTMETVGRLLTKPNFRIIHLIRDPRPVVASRLVAPTFHGLYSKSKQPSAGRVREAKIYCNTLRRDLAKRRELEAEYPGRIIQVVYEDFVKHPVEYAKSVYDFLGYDIPAKLVPWVASHTNNQKNGGKNTNKGGGGGGKKKAAKQNETPRWLRVMSDKEIRDVEAACADIPQLVGFKWSDWRTA